jgi:hypothetical protein
MGLLITKMCAQITTVNYWDAFEVRIQYGFVRQLEAFWYELVLFPSWNMYEQVPYIPDLHTFYFSSQTPLTQKLSSTKKTLWTIFWKRE